MITVIAEDFIDPRHLDAVRPLYEELVQKTRQEPLCISYELHEDAEKAGHFVFIEEWPNEEALEKHCNTEHFKRLVAMISEYAVLESKFMILNKIFS